MGDCDEKSNIPKLAKLCHGSVAFGILHGYYSQPFDKFDDWSSTQEILSELRARKTPITKQLATDLSQFCTLNGVSMGPENTYSHLLHLISFQSLTALNVTEPMHLCRVEPSAGTERSPDPKQIPNYKIDLQKFLFSQLGKSKESMRIFCLKECTYSLFTEDWVDAMCKALPSLVVLELEGCDLNNAQFETLTSHYPNLLSLSIVQTKVTSLQSISKLENLRELKLRGVKLNSVKDMEEMFQLQHLTDLDISGALDPTACKISVFAACNKVLPNLRFLDCSFSRLTLQLVRRVIRTHPTLEMIGLLGSGINRDFIISKDESIQVFNEASLLNCCRAIEQYSKKQWHIQLHRAIVSTDRFINVSDDQPPTVEVSNCLDLLISTLHRVTPGPRKAIACCFKSITWVLNHQLLSAAQKNSLIEAVVKHIRGYTTYTTNGPYYNKYDIHSAYVSFWNTLAECREAATVENKRRIHELGLEQFYFIVCPFRLGPILGVLEELCLKDKDYKCEDMFHRQSLLRHLIVRAKSQRPTGEWLVPFKHILAFIVRFYEVGDPGREDLLDYEMVQYLVDVLKENGTDDIQTMVRKALKYFVKADYPLLRQFCFEKTNFDVLIKPLSQNLAPTPEGDLRMEVMIVFFISMETSLSQKTKMASWCEVARGFFERNSWEPGTEMWDILTLILNDEGASEIHDWANSMKSAIGLFQSQPSVSVEH